MIRSLYCIVGILGVFVCSTLLAQERWGWELPQQLDQRNLSVSFEVDSTWHTIHGTVPGVSGEVRLSDPKNPLSLNVRVLFPVKLFDTGNDSRDKRLREVMAAEKFSDVEVIASGLPKECVPDLLELREGCQGSLNGRVTIRGVTLELPLPFSLVRREGLYLLDGTVTLDWSRFGVEDPSILVARLAKQVVVHYAASVPALRR